MTSLADQHDLLLLDLDGTVYRGGLVIEHVPTALAQARQRGAATMFITNNASTAPGAVAAKLAGMGIPAAPDDVLTSAQAGAATTADLVPAGSAVLIVGSESLAEEIRNVGLRPVFDAAKQPRAVVQGLAPNVGWPILAEAMVAITAGAIWVACNGDTTLPSERGLLPGNGALVAALAAALNRQPIYSGKPERLLLDMAVQQRCATRPLVVGDRLNTDVEAACRAGLPCLMPLTGVNDVTDLLAAPATQRPTHLCLDLRGLHDPHHVTALGIGHTDQRWQTSFNGQRLTLTGQSPATELDDATVLAAAAVLLGVAWQHPVGAIQPGDQLAAAALARLSITAEN